MKPCQITVLGALSAFGYFMVVHLLQMLSFGSLIIGLAEVLPCLLLAACYLPINSVVQWNIAVQVVLAGCVLGVGIYAMYWGVFWPGLLCSVWGGGSLSRLFPYC
jgi:hypothetical protein